MESQRIMLKRKLKSISMKKEVRQYAIIYPNRIQNDRNN